MKVAIPMKSPLHILYLEEDDLEVQFVNSVLQNDGVASVMSRVATETEFRAALQAGGQDLILSDYSLPGYDGLAAIRLAQQLQPDVPFIFVSGSISEEKAIELLSSGAMDYVRSNSIGRIVPSIVRALREGETRVQRKRAELKIREQAALIDITRDAILVHDLQQRIRFWNKGAERLYGWTEAEAVGRTASELLHPKGFQEFPHFLQTAATKGDWSGELTQSAKDGRGLTVESRWTFIRDAEGQPAGLLVVNSDITERKKIEAQFLRSQRMESIGTLAGGIAHDLNNVLAPILMATHILKARHPEEASRRLIQTLENSTLRGAGIVKQVLTFARGLEGDHAPIHSRLLVQGMVSIVRETFPKSLNYHSDAPDNLWLINGDVTQLDQVLLNLCVNARDAMPGGGTLSLSAQNITVDEHFAQMNRHARPGPYVVFLVRDTGTGIPPEILDKIFEPFFTTKEVGKGTGLGLSTVMGIVKSHGGFLDIDSKLGIGTTFKVYFPALPSTEVPAAPKEIAIPRGRGELILVVDDDASILEVTTTTLEASGYQVLTAADGVEAVAIFARQDSKIAVVLTEMTMPGLDGPATIRVLKKLNPAVKIIVCSSVVSPKYEAEVTSGEVRAYLRKPFAAEQLLVKLDEVIRTA